MKNVKIYFFASVALAGLALSACQHETPEAAVTRRSAERWAYLIAGQPSKAYDYLSPGYRSTHTMDQYIAGIAQVRLKWTGTSNFKVQQCEAETCKLTLTIAALLPGALAHAPKDIPLESPATELWVSDGGSWYFRPEPDAGLLHKPDEAAPQKAAIGNQAASGQPAPQQPDSANH
jgi:hypothetical protein